MHGQENQLVALSELGNDYGQGTLRCPIAWPGEIKEPLSLFALLQDLG